MHRKQSTTGANSAFRIALGALAILAGPAAFAQTFTTLYNFQGSPDGTAPQATVIVGSSGSLYGTTYAGGANKDGTVFDLSPPSSPGGAWTESVLYSFQGTPDGLNPSAGVTFGSSGTLFGTTYRGGSGIYAGGTIFELTPPSTTGAAWSETVLYNFPGNFRDHGGTGAPLGTLLLSGGGRMFGTAGGNCVQPFKEPSIVFELTPPAVPGDAWTEFIIYNFDPNPQVGCDLRAGVISQGGTLYGTAYGGGNYNACLNAFAGCGTVYELTPPAATGGKWTATAIHIFSNAPDGALPSAPLTAGPGGVIYGTTTAGGISTCGCGIVFQLIPPATPGGAWTETILYSFTGANGDGASPAGDMLLAANGSLYGTTTGGGSASRGTVFQLAPPSVPGGAWTETVLHSFSGTDGSKPNGLTQGPGTTLYGSTQSGGTHGSGTVFSITPN